MRTKEFVTVSKHSRNQAPPLPFLRNPPSENIIGTLCILKVNLDYYPSPL